MISPEKMQVLLEGRPEGTLLFCSYRAGREPTERAIREAGRAGTMGLARRHFVGKLIRMWTTKKGDLVLTILTEERDRTLPDGTLAPPAFRTFNPALGELIHLEVLEGE
jgi:hypothetical protein